MFRLSIHRQLVNVLLIDLKKIILKHDKGNKENKKYAKDLFFANLENSLRHTEHVSQIIKLHRYGE